MGVECLTSALAEVSSLRSGTRGSMGEGAGPTAPSDSSGPFTIVLPMYCTREAARGGKLL